LGFLRKTKEANAAELQAAVTRGARAEHLAADEALADAFEKVEGVYMNAWRSADPFDVETRERAWIATRLLTDIKEQILSTVREGVAAQKQIERALRQ
jgi:hypothetical protein